MVPERKIALLVDAENVSHHRIDQVMAELSRTTLVAWLQSSVYTQIGLSPIFPHGRLCFKSMPSFLSNSTLLPLARTLRILP